MKGTTAVSPLLAITHKHHLAASHQKEKTSHLHDSAKHVKTMWNCLKPKYLGSADAAAFKKKCTYTNSILQIFLFCTYATNIFKFRSLTCCFDDCLQPLILAHYNVQLKGFPDPLHNLTSAPFHPFPLSPPLFGRSLPCSRA